MSFNQLVIRNTIRNRHLYMAYFLSTMFSVMVFFTFNVFAQHPSLSDGLNSSVQTGMTAAAVIIYGFAFLFVLYSMDVFLQSRKKEFGVLMIQGMSPKQLRKMVFIENLVIGFFATIFGSIFGIGFSQLILWISKFLVHVDFGFYFPTQAILITIVSFFILFLAISFFIQFRLPKLSLQELLKAGEFGKGVIKPSLLKAILSVILIGGGYAVAILVPGQMVPIVMLPVIFVVIVGTSLFFNQFSVGLIESLKKRQKLFWKKTNMIVFSDLSFRMKDNARSFFLVSVITTVAFAAIGTLYGLQELLVGQMDLNPYEVTVYNTPSAELDQEVAQVNQLFAEDNISVNSTTVHYFLDANSGNQYMTVSEYNQLANLADLPELSLADGEVLALSSTNFTTGEAPSSVSINGTDYTVKGTEQTQVVSAFSNYYLVPDSVNTSGMTEYQSTNWVAPGADYDALVATGKKIFAEFADTQPKTFLRQTTLDGYAPILFVGIFIGIVFFVSAGSFLYFRLYSDMDVDVEKFRMIYKLGLSKKELKKMIYQQVGILFFTPIIVSVIHGAVALTAMYHVFNMDMQLAGWEVLGVFVLIQVIYYLIARIFYFNKVYLQVTA
ncbi:ABC transporter permease [Enterococcus sp. LJL90]